MSRKISFAPDEYYHVYNRGTDKRVIFLEPRDEERFIALLYLANTKDSVHISNYQGLALMELLALERDDSLVHIGAYCLMPNHFHILIKERDPEGLSFFMHKLLTGYTMYFNKKYERTGTLFEGNFKARHVDEDIYLNYLLAYIHLNPVKIIDSNWKENGIKDIKKAEKFLSDYQSSSYHHYLGSGGDESVILEPAEFPGYFQNPREFKDFVRDWLNYKSSEA